MKDSIGTLYGLITTEKPDYPVIGEIKIVSPEKMKWLRDECYRRRFETYQPWFDA